MAATAAVDAASEEERAANQAKALEAMDAARDEKLRDEEIIVADAARERKMNTSKAKKAAEAEQAERIKENGTEKRTSVLLDAICTEELEKTATTISDAAADIEQKGNRRRASSAAEEARAEKLADIAAVDAAAERERAANQAKALEAMDAARDEKLVATEQKDADAARERKRSQKLARQASEKERADRVAEHGDAVRAAPSHAAMDPAAAAAKAPAAAPAAPAKDDVEEDSSFVLCGSKTDETASHHDITASICGGATHEEDKKGSKKSCKACAIM